MSPRRRAVVLGLVAAGTVGAAAAREPGRYGRAAPSPDGTGRTFMGREIAPVMGWQGAGWLERSEREAEEQTTAMVAALALRPGDVVADVGAGTGYIARRLAASVGAQGRVEAIDVQPEMVRMLADLANKAALPQIRPRLGAADDVKLADSSVDLAIMVDVYHELEHPFEVLASIVRALKPAGRVVFVEYKAEDPRVPIKPLHKMSVAQIKREAALHETLAFQRVVDTLPWQHMVFFRKTSR